MASTLVAMASTLVAMASNLVRVMFVYYITKSIQVQ